MEKATPPGHKVWQSLAQGLRWVARVAVTGVALYVLFPPLWDAAFEADLDSLHEAPYIAADRARHLWNGIRDSLRDSSGRKHEPAAGIAAAGQGR